MLAMLTGSVALIEVGCAVIDVGGVGFEVRMPSSDLSTMHTGNQVRIYTYLNVTNDNITLYGFLATSSKQLFTQLQKVSGVGPKVALSLLSTLTPTMLTKAVFEGDVAALSSAPGLGKKGAQKIILELSGKMNVSSDDVNTEIADEGSQQVIEGLQSLGWQQAEAQKVVRRICQDGDYQLPLKKEDVPQVLKASLASLDRGR